MSGACLCVSVRVTGTHLSHIPRPLLVAEPHCYLLKVHYDEWQNEGAQVWYKGTFNNPVLPSHAQTLIRSYPRGSTIWLDKVWHTMLPSICPQHTPHWTADFMYSDHRCRVMFCPSIGLVVGQGLSFSTNITLYTITSFLICASGQLYETYHVTQSLVTLGKWANINDFVLSLHA